MNECLKAIQPVFRIVRRDPFGEKRSFNDLFRGRDDGPIQVNRRGGSGLTFSETEKKEIKESVVILTIAFAMALTGGLSAVMNDVRTFLIYEIPFAFVAVMTGFLLHEIAHKWMAVYYGCWAEYRGNRSGLLVAVLMSTFGFLLAAPGAVMIMGRINDKQHGHIAAVGPLTNVILAMIAMPIYAMEGGGIANGLGELSILGSLARFLIIINLILAGFNMIPVSPLDGSKVLAWSFGAYCLVVACILAAANTYWSL